MGRNGSGRNGAWVSLVATFTYHEIKSLADTDVRWSGVWLSCFHMDRLQIAHLSRLIRQFIEITRTVS